jgi:hypothetical protein
MPRLPLTCAATKTQLRQSKGTISSPSGQIDGVEFDDFRDFNLFSDAANTQGVKIFPHGQEYYTPVLLLSGYPIETASQLHPT